MITNKGYVPIRKDFEMSITVVNDNTVEADDELETADEDTAEDLSEEEVKKKRWQRKKQNTDLIEAILESDNSAVDRLLRQGVSPMVRCQGSMTTVGHLAALRNEKAILEKLLQHSRSRGLDRQLLWSRDQMGRQAHHLAAAAGHLDTLRILLDADSELVNSKVDRTSHQDIHHEDLDSFLHDHAEVSNLMISVGEGSTVLHIAARYNHQNMVDYLLEMDADANVTDGTGLTPLDVAGMESGPSGFQAPEDEDENESGPVVICGGTQANAGRNDLSSPVESDYSPITPFSLISSPTFFSSPLQGKPFTQRRKKHPFGEEMVNKTTTVFSSLIKKGAKLSHTPSVSTTTPLHRFVEISDSNSIGNLLRASSGFQMDDIKELINKTDYLGRTPIHLAVELNLLEPLKLLLENGKDALNKKDNQGRTALHIAVQYEWTKGIEVLLDEGTDLKSVTNDGETVLHIAAKKRNPKILQTLLERTSNSVVNKKDKRGYTALFIAIESVEAQCVELLLDSRKPTLCLPDRSNLLHMAVKSKATNILDLIVKKLQLKDTQYNMKNTAGLTPLHLSVEVDAVSCMEYLLGCNLVDFEKERDVDKGGNFVHIAAEHGRYEALKLIIGQKRFAPLLIKKDKKGREPLILAAMGGHSECASLLLRNGANLAARSPDKTALDIIFYNMPQAVTMLDDLLDSFMVKSDEREDSPNFQVSLDYRLLLADVRNNDRRQLGVIEAFITCGNERLRQKLFLHPLTESFLFFKWNQLKFFFRILVFIFLMHTFALTAYSILTYVYNLPQYARICEVIVLLMLIPIITLEVLNIHPNMSYIRDSETWVKWSVISTSILVFTLPNQPWMRYLTSFSLLLSWIQQLFLFARNPKLGLRVLMFLEVATNVFQVLSTFLFLILGFAFAFLIMFNGQHPFTNIGATMSKIFIMMVELDYNGVYSSDEADMVSPIGILGRILYLGFVILVVMVMTNLMVGMSVSDVAELEAQGNSRRVAKQAAFLVIFEKICYKDRWLKCLPTFLQTVIHNRRSAPNSTSVYPNRKRDGDNPLPRLLKTRVLQTVLNRDDQAELEMLHDKIETLTEMVKQMNQTLKDLKNK